MPTASTDAATAASAPFPVIREPVADTASPANPFAALPSLVGELPPAGKRIALPPLAGSADALALAQIGVDAHAEKRMLVVVCSDALAATRLAAEIAWFAPSLAVGVFPDWETLPYDHFSPHQDLVSERL